MRNEHPLKHIPKILAKLKKLKTFRIDITSQHPTKSHRPIPTPQGGNVLHAVAPAVVEIAGKRIIRMNAIDNIFFMLPTKYKFL